MKQNYLHVVCNAAALLLMYKVHMGTSECVVFFRISYFSPEKHVLYQSKKLSQFTKLLFVRAI